MSSGGASSNGWADHVCALYEEDPTLDPIEYFQQVVIQFPDVSKKQVKNKVKKLRDAAEKAYEKAQGSVEDPGQASKSSGSSLVGPDFLMFGDPRSDHGRAPEPLAPSECVRPTDDWEVQKTDVIGYGVYARGVVSAGDFIIREKPLLQARLDKHTGKSKIAEILNYRTQLEDAFVMLDLQDQIKFMKLADCSKLLLQHCTDHETSAAAKLRDIIAEEPRSGVAAVALKELVRRGDCSQDDASGKSVPGVFVTNAIPAEDFGTYSLCPHIARFNHSCAPNAIYGFDKDVGDHYVRAIRNIEAGDEICVHYMGFEGDRCEGLALHRSAERSRYMQSNFGSPCACMKCAAPDCSVSDRNRQHIKELYDTLYDHINFRDIEGKATRMLELLQDEGLHFPALIRRLAQDVDAAARQIRGGAPRGMERRLLMWKRLQYEAQRFMYTEFREYTQQLKEEGKRLEVAAEKHGKRSK
eukprot:gb/GFBE01040628.1/.p1 GENE.gb/GFBE01040628.1/~~gb/GFBE01040628.1/.p1  ORF type:complete len:469 (+),score=72.04 gb/GFBE01040628.1/:1-1407(+)